MTKQESKQGPAATKADVPPLTVDQHHSAIRRMHRGGEGWQIRAGVAVVEAIEAGAVTFERKVPEGSPEACKTRTQLAAFLGTSPTTVSKYRSLGLATRLGYGPDHADWATITGSHSAAWMVEALLTGKRPVVDAAIADHRKGSQRGSGGSKGKNVGGKGKGKAASTRNEAPKDAPTTRINVAQRVVSVASWLAANNGQRLSGLSGEALDSILASLRTAADAVEAEVAGRKASKASKAA